MIMGLVYAAWAFGALTLVLLGVAYAFRIEAIRRCLGYASISSATTTLMFTLKVAAAPAIGQPSDVAFELSRAHLVFRRTADAFRRVKDIPPDRDRMGRALN
jgi:hypothetical protein